MRLSKNKTIIGHIPVFLEYCKKEKHFLPKSIENYSRFLNRFIAYLKNSNQIQLLPHQLSDKHVQDYKLYLSKTVHPVTKKPISKVTQNFYLIAVRALLSYFLEKDITSLLSDKIKLLKQDDYKPKNILLSSEQLKKLLSAPNTSSRSGLRDRAILETILYTGLKVKQLVSLNRDNIEIRPKNLKIKISNIKGIAPPRIISVPESATHWLKKYLKTRDDDNKALFINYRARKSANRRLSVRYIEKSIRKYITDNNLPPLLTPETLRDVYIFHLLNQEIKITNPSRHKVFIIKAYNINSSTISCNTEEKKSKFPAWHIVENIINKEISWLKDKILIMPGKYRRDRLIKNCDDCFFRKLAILIVSGKVRAIEFKAKNKKGLWNTMALQEEAPNITRHGKEWHQKMMDIVSNYFRTQNYKIVLEPTLNFGRADLGIYQNPKKVIYIEIGTVSLFKLWYNLSTIKNITFLLVPFEGYTIELKA